MRFLRILALSFVFMPAAFGGTVSEVVFKTVDSFYFGIDAHFVIDGLSSDGVQTHLDKRVFGTNNSDLGAIGRICETSVRQMMLKPGKWLLTLASTSDAPSFISICKLDAVK